MDEGETASSSSLVAGLGVWVAGSVWRYNRQSVSQMAPGSSISDTEAGAFKPAREGERENTGRMRHFRKCSPWKHQLCCMSHCSQAE